MVAALSWEQIAFRLALTVAAGFLIGFDCGERSRPAGIANVAPTICLLYQPVGETLYSHPRRAGLHLPNDDFISHLKLHERQSSRSST